MGKADGDFNGFITRDGEIVPIQDTERVSAIFLKTVDLDGAIEILWNLAAQCAEAGYHQSCCEYIEKVLPLLDAPDAKAACFLQIGTAWEHAQDYEAAYRAYSRAFDLPQKPNDSWYFLNNNSGFCLNQSGRHLEAERYCRAAIEINPSRHNAYKNLGVALAGQGRCAEAASNYIRATRLCPADARAVGLLDRLFAENKTALDEIPDFGEQLIECHELVCGAQGNATRQ